MTVQPDQIPIEIPAPRAPAGTASANHTLTHNTPAHHTPTHHIPANHTPANHTPANHTPAQHTPAQHLVAGQVGADRPKGRLWSIRSAPVREPRFDDERPARHLSLVAACAPALPFETSPPQPGETRPSDRRLVAVSTVTVAPVASRASALPEPERFGRQFFTGLLEVLSGRRSAAQLAPLTTPGIHAGIVRDALANDRLGCAGRRPALQSMRVMEPADGVAELSGVIVIGRRCRAVAARLEGLEGRWRCVRLQIG